MMLYCLQLDLPSKMRRQPGEDVLCAADTGIVLEDPARMEAIIQEAVRCIKATKYAPTSDDIREAVEHVRSVPYGRYHFSPRVPNSYQYPIDGISMDVFHAHFDDSCSVRVLFSVDRVKHADYGRPAVRRLGPGEVGWFTVVAVVRPDVAAEVAQKELAELEARFPGATAVFSPMGSPWPHVVSPYSCIVEDDGVLVLVRTPDWKCFLGTPIGWFGGSRYVAKSEAPGSIYSFLRRHGISYPRQKSRRAWTGELAMQIVFIFGPPTVAAAGDSTQS